VITGIPEPRPPGEWARQLTHEFGHLALPGVDHYREPEAWANGLLGERLLLKWLLANPAIRLRLLDGLNAADQLRERIAPLIRGFLAEGPASPLANGASAEAMNWYLGLALYVEAALGPSALSDAMAMTRSTRAATFLLAVQRVMAQRAERGVTLQAAGEGSLWLYLPAGRWRVGDREVVGGWERVTASQASAVTVRREGPGEVRPQ
jgi:hypothetical protein